MTKHKPRKAYKVLASKIITVDGKSAVVRQYAPRAAYAGADTWRQRGGFITVTGGNGIGIVPVAFQRAVYA